MNVEDKALLTKLNERIEDLSTPSMEKCVQKVYTWLETAGKTFGDESEIPTAIELVKEETSEFFEGLTTNDKDEVLDGFADAFFTLLNAAYYFGVTPEELNKKFEQVIASNYSKFCKTKSEVYTTQVKYKLGTHPNKPGVMISTTYKTTGNKEYPYVVLNAETLKILKSINYKEPNEYS